MDNRASSLFAQVRGCKDSSGLREIKIAPLARLKRPLDALPTALASGGGSSTSTEIHGEDDLRRISGRQDRFSSAIRAVKFPSVTDQRTIDTVEVWGSSPHVPTISKRS
jgi:hypothetical protein